MVPDVDNIPKYLKYFVSQGADIRVEVRAGITPLHYAAMGGDVELAKLLVSKGANVYSKDAGGRIQLDLAKDGLQFNNNAKEEKAYKAVVDYLSIQK
jgi:ankyrin repeat protein